MRPHRLLTTYFTSKPHPLYGHAVEKDSVAYLEPWYRSTRKLGLAGVVFHDGLSDRFVAAHETSEIEFIRVDPSRFEYSVNDQRFFVYDRFLRSHPEIQKVFMTDASDVVVVQDPFPFMEPGLVYVGNQPGRLHPPEPEGDTLGYMSYSFIRERLETSGSPYAELLAGLGRRAEGGEYPVLNAGIVGGCRPVALSLLAAVTKVLREIGKPRENLNMAVLNYVVYRDSAFDVVTGEPVHSRFGGYENERQDVWFVHK